jgi:hypothetical protein
MKPLALILPTLSISLVLFLALGALVLKVGNDAAARDAELREGISRMYVNQLQIDKNVTQSCHPGFSL